MKNLVPSVISQSLYSFEMTVSIKLVSSVIPKAYEESLKTFNSELQTSINVHIF